MRAAPCGRFGRAYRAETVLLLQRRRGNFKKGKKRQRLAVRLCRRHEHCYQFVLFYTMRALKSIRPGQILVFWGPKGPKNREKPPKRRRTLGFSGQFLAPVQRVLSPLWQGSSTARAANSPRLRSILAVFLYSIVKNVHPIL